MGQIPGGQDSKVALGESERELAHSLINRFAVAQSAAQRLGKKLAGLGIEDVLEDLDGLTLAIQGCSETIKQMRAAGGETLNEGGSGEESLAPEQQDAGVYAAPGERTTCSGRVLYVEDNSQVREYVASALVRAGWHVTAVEGVAEALEMLYSTPFDVVLTDIRLRSGSGLTLAAHAGRQSPGIPVGILTGWDIIEDLPDNVSFVLQKPVADETLVNALTQALRTGGNPE